MKIMMNTVFIIFSVLSSALHPFHISVTDIEYDEEVKSIEIAQKIFIDDFEEALAAFSNSKIDLLDKSQKTSNDQLIEHYISEKFNIEINGKSVESDFLGTQLEEDAIWCFLEVSKVRKLNSIRIKNTLFFELFDDQMNLVHIKKDGEIKSMRLIKDKAERKFEYE